MLSGHALWDVGKEGAVPYGLWGTGPVRISAAADGAAVMDVVDRFKIVFIQPNYAQHSTPLLCWQHTSACGGGCGIVASIGSGSSVRLPTATQLSNLRCTSNIATSSDSLWECTL